MSDEKKPKNKVEEAFHLMGSYQHGDVVIQLSDEWLRQTRRARWRLMLLSRIHPFASKRAQYRSALNILEGIDISFRAQAMAQHFYDLGSRLKPPSTDPSTEPSADPR